MLYLISFLALALFPSLLAAYGVYLAAKVLDGKDRKWAFIIVWTLAILGVLSAGLQQFIVYKSDEANEAKRRISADEVHDLKGEIHGLRGDTSNLIRTMAGMFPMVASLNSELATIRKDAEAAKEHRDPHLIANLEEQAQTAQQQVDNLAHDLVTTTISPQVARQLRDWDGERRNKQQDLHNKGWEDRVHWQERHPNDPNGIDQAMKDWDNEYKKADEESIAQLSKIIATADFIRKQMLQRIPSQQQSAEDKKQEAAFSQARNDPESLNRDDAARYLEGLAKRVPPSK